MLLLLLLIQLSKAPLLFERWPVKRAHLFHLNCQNSFTDIRVVLSRDITVFLLVYPTPASCCWSKYFDLKHWMYGCPLVLNCRTKSIDSKKCGFILKNCFYNAPHQQCLIWPLSSIATKAFLPPGRWLLSGLIVANKGKKGRIWENGRFSRRRQQIRKLGNESSCVTVSLVAIQRKISTANLHWDLCDTDI